MELLFPKIVYKHFVNYLFCRPENTERKKNVDRLFAMSFTKDVKELDPLLGPDVLLVVSMDDKARVPIGKAAANEQSPLLMCLEYKVRLPDHDFPLGQRYNLIPSVYAQCDVLSDGKVSYSGKTFIR